jgi:predicted nucleotidyltransferase
MLEPSPSLLNIRYLLLVRIYIPAVERSNEQSDIDLIIVAPSDERPLERRMELRRMLVEYDRRI